jgi:hypothetical protein
VSSSGEGRPGPPAWIPVVLGVLILGAPVAGFVLGSQVQSASQCIEACFLVNLVPMTYSFIFGISAVVNLAMLPAAIGRRGIPRDALPSLGRLVVAQFVLLALAGIWLASFAGWPGQIGALAALAIAAASVAVCVLTGLAIGRRRAADGLSPW